MMCILLDYYHFIQWVKLIFIIQVKFYLNIIHINLKKVIYIIN